VSIDQYEVLSSQRVFTGRVISMRTDQLRMSDGSVSTREIVEHPGAVAIVALDDDDEVVLVTQYRHPVRQYVTELPAGLLDVAGESGLLAAQRELYEEAALTASDWHLLVDILPSPGMSDESIRVFLARGLADVPMAERFVPEHEEITMTVTRRPLDEVAALALAGDLTNGAAVAGVLAAQVARANDWRGLRPANAPWPARPGR
jgi:8-oxo-dGDP phosphatase